MLNKTQQYLLDAFLKYSFLDIEEQQSSLAIRAFQTITGSISIMDEPIFQSKGIIDAIKEIINILNHPCPQNRSTGSPYVGQEDGYVVWEPDGHGFGSRKRASRSSVLDCTK